MTLKVPLSVAIFSTLKIITIKSGHFEFAAALARSSLAEEQQLSLKFPLCGPQNNDSASNVPCMRRGASTLPQMSLI